MWVTVCINECAGGCGGQKMELHPPGTGITCFWATAWVPGAGLPSSASPVSALNYCSISSAPVQTFFFLMSNKLLWVSICTKFPFALQQGPPQLISHTDTMCSLFTKQLTNHQARYALYFRIPNFGAMFFCSRLHFSFSISACYYFFYNKRLTSLSPGSIRSELFLFPSVAGHHVRRAQFIKPLSTMFYF